MNYGVNSGGSGKDSMAKKFLSINRRATMGRKQQNYHSYMDKMNSSLNKCIQENITPYWRNHQSLKGT